MTKKTWETSEQRSVLAQAATCQDRLVYHCGAEWECNSQTGWHRAFLTAIQYSVILIVQTHSVCCPSTQTQARPLLCCHCTKLGLLKHSSHAPMTPDGSFSLRRCRMRQSSSVGQRYTTRTTLSSHFQQRKKLAWIHMYVNMHTIYFYTCFFCSRNVTLYGCSDIQ